MPPSFLFFFLLSPSANTNKVSLNKPEPKSNYLRFAGIYLKLNRQRLSPFGAQLWKDDKVPAVEIKIRLIRPSPAPLAFSLIIQATFQAP